MNEKSYRKTRPLLYALGMLGTMIPGRMIDTFLVFFYNIELGIPLAKISLITLFATIWDAVNDPLFGYLSDRTRTKIGRRKPWMIVGMPLFCLSYIMLFSPHKLVQNTTSLIVYFAFFSILTETLRTIIDVNYYALFPELFIEEKSRTHVNALRQAFQIVGMIIGVTLAPIMIQAYGYTITATFMVLIGMFFYAIATFSSHERPEYTESQIPSLKETLKAVGKNKNFWAVGFSNFFFQASSALLLLSIPYFVKYALELSEGNAAFLTAAVFVSAIPAMFLWTWLINKFGSLKTWRVSLIFLGISLVPFLFVHTLIVSMVAGIFTGVVLAGVIINIDLVFSKVIDIDSKVSNLRREGMYFSALQFIVHLSGLAKSLVLLLIAAIFGFVDANNPGTHPDIASRFMLSFFPAVLMLVAFIISFFVDFNDSEVQDLDNETSS